VLVKFVLEAIPIYWISLSKIPKGILEWIRRINFMFGEEGAEGDPSIKVVEIGCL
jgi:hypothetical protein